MWKSTGNRYKWVRKETNHLPSKPLISSGNNGHTTSHYSASKYHRRDHRGEAVPTHSGNKSFDEKANKKATECRKMLDRLDTVMKQVKSAVASESRRTFVTSPSKMVGTTKSAEQCKKCIVNRSRNPYQYVKCSCKVKNQQHSITGSQRNPRIPALKMPCVEKERQVLETSNVCINRTAGLALYGKKDSAFKASEIPTTSFQSRVINPQSSDDQRKSFNPAVRKVCKTEAKESEDPNFIKSRFMLDRRTKSQRCRPAIKLTHRGHVKMPSESVVSPHGGITAKRKTGSDSPVFKSRYTLDRRQRKSVITSNNSNHKPITTVVKSSMTKKNQRRENLRQQGFIVTHFKMRRRSYTPAVRTRRNSKYNKVSESRTPVSARSPSKIKHTVQNAQNPTNQRFYKQAIVRAKYCLINRRRPYCIQFIRTGKCKSRASCRFIHDSSTVRICPRFLSGTCNQDSCHLCHENDPNRMPVCLFFENGVCSRGGDCPFQHIKLPLNTPICTDFQWTFCPLGAKCHRRHVLGTRSFVRRKAAVSKENSVLDTSKRAKSKSVESDSFLPLLSDSEDEGNVEVDGESADERPE